MSLTLSSGYIFADCIIVNGNPPSAQLGHGNFLLGLTFQFVVKKSDTPRALLGLSGNLLLGGRFVCPLNVSEGQVAIESNSNNDYTITKTFSAILSRENLNSIEEARCGGDIALGIHFDALVLIDRSRFEVVRDDLSYLIAQTQWLKMLASWKFAENIFLEIPVQSEIKNYKAAFLYFTKAQALYGSGNWEQAVSECRKVLDHLHESLLISVLDSIHKS